MGLPSFAQATYFSGIWVSWKIKKREIYETGGAGVFGSSPKDFNRLPRETSSRG